MPAIQRLCEALHYLADAQRTIRRLGSDNSDRNPAGYRQLRQDVQEDIDSAAHSRRLSLDSHINLERRRRLSIEALVVFPSRNNNIMASEADARESTHIAAHSNPNHNPNPNHITKEDHEAPAPAPVRFSPSPPLYIPNPALPPEAELLVREDYFEDWMNGLRLRSLLALEPTKMPMGRECAIRAVLEPVGGVSEGEDGEDGEFDLDPCFCGDVYVDARENVNVNVNVGRDTHQAVRLPGCSHVFGKCCIVKWLNGNTFPVCPLCRKRVRFTGNVPSERKDAEELYRVIREIARSIKGACHIRKKHRHRNNDDNNNNNSSAYIEHHVNVYHHVPVVTDLYSVFPRVTIPVDAAEDSDVASTPPTLYLSRASSPGHPCYERERTFTPSTFPSCLLPSRVVGNRGSRALPTRVISNPESRALVSRVPVAVRSASLQSRATSPTPSDPQSSVSNHQQESNLQEDIPAAVESVLVQRRVVSAPQPSTQPQVASTSSISASSSVVAASSSTRVASSRVPVCPQRPTQRSSRIPTATRYISTQTRAVVTSQQTLSRRVSTSHEPSPLQFVIESIEANSGVGGSSTPHGSTLDGDDNSSNAAGNTSSTGQRVRNHGTSESSATHQNRSYNSSLSNSEAGFGIPGLRPLSEPVDPSRQAANSPISPVLDHPLRFQRTRAQAPSSSQISPHARRDLPVRSHIPRSQGMYNLPTVDDELNNPIHPRDFDTGQYAPVNRDPGPREERAPAPYNHVHRHVHRQRNHHRSRQSDHHRRNSHGHRVRAEGNAINRRGDREVANEKKKLDGIRLKYIASILTRAPATDPELYKCFCLESFAGPDHKAVKMPHCRHIFGKHCITTWLKENNSCPLCRAEIQLPPRGLGCAN
ncbi:Ubiquitin-protein ligase [Ciborinia camelliae]|nr:Ubiquitin-protein ligase [Ciborinia camelliae]